MRRLGEIGHFDEAMSVTDTSTADACRELAEAHGESIESMTRLWRALGASPPTDRARLDAYKSNQKLMGELTRRFNAKLDEVKDRATSLSFRCSQLEALAESKPSIETMLGWIKDSRLRVFAERFDPRKNGGAIVLGPTGCGKTVAALCMMVRCIVDAHMKAFEHDCSVPFTSRAEHTTPPRWAAYDARDIGNAVQRTPLGEPEPAILRDAASASVLILEDLGWERNFHIESLIDVAAPRYRRQLPTIVTSGEKHDALRERYTDAVLRRFWNIEGKDGAIIDCWGKP